MWNFIPKEDFLLEGQCDRAWLMALPREKSIGRRELPQHTAAMSKGYNPLYLNISKLNTKLDT